MDLDVRGVAVSAVAVFVAGLALWPPGSIYWSEVAGDLGGGPTLALVGTVAVVFGVVVASVLDVEMTSFGGGTVLAFAGLATVATLSSPDPPVYVVWYGLLGICVFVGATAVLVYRRGSVELYPVGWAF